MSSSPHVIDVDSQNFQRKVLDESLERPVVVDFWASWCGPCRQLGPVLEQLAEEGGGRWLLAKLDTERSPELASEFRIRSIPAVKVFLGGQLVDEFTGALPRRQIVEFLKRFVGGPADDRADEAERLLDAGDQEGAAGRYQQALEIDPHHPRSLLALAQLAVSVGENKAAEELIGRLHLDDARRYQAAVAQLKLQIAGGGDEDSLRAALAENDADSQTRLELGRLLAAQQRWEDALQELLTVVRREKGPLRDEARQAMVGVFEAIGIRTPLADRYQRKLAMAIY